MMNLSFLPFQVDGLKLLVIFVVLVLVYWIIVWTILRISRRLSFFWRKNRWWIQSLTFFVLLVLAMLFSLGRKGEGEGREGGANGQRSTATGGEIGGSSGLTPGSYRLHGRVNENGGVILQLDGDEVHKRFAFEGDGALESLRADFLEALRDAEPGGRLELHLAEPFPRAVRRALWEWSLQLNLMVRET